MPHESDSDDPLMESNNKTINTTTYAEILKYDCDTNKKVFVRDIQITIDATTNVPIIDISINGERKLRDFQMQSLTLNMGFSGHLIITSRMKKPSLLIKAKNNGGGNSTITVVITGLKVPYTSKVGPPYGQG